MHNFSSSFFVSSFDRDHFYGDVEVKIPEPRTVERSAGQERDLKSFKVLGILGSREIVLGILGSNVINLGILRNWESWDSLGVDLGILGSSEIDFG